MSANSHLILIDGTNLPLLFRFQEFLRRSRTDNFLDLDGMGALYRSGQDFLGRHVVVFVGSKCCASKVDSSKVKTCVCVCVCVCARARACVRACM